MSPEKSDFTLEKLKIREDLNLLITESRAFRELHTYKLEKLEEDNEHTKYILNGNGKIGVVGKVEEALKDINEMKESKKQDGIIAKTALVGVIIEFIRGLFFHVK